MIVGASIVLREKDNYVFEIQKPEKWITRNDGYQEIGIGCIGGTVEKGETAIQALHREIEEEICCEITLDKHKKCHELLPDGNIRTNTDLSATTGIWLIWYFNQEAYQKNESIVVYTGCVRGVPTPGDLPGIIKLNQSLLFRLVDMSLSFVDLSNMGGVIISRQEIPRNAVIKPIGTTGLILQLFKNAPYILKSGGFQI